jgi:hypothetical protein
MKNRIAIHVFINIAAVVRTSTHKLAQLQSGKPVLNESSHTYAHNGRAIIASALHVITVLPHFLTAKLQVWGGGRGAARKFEGNIAAAEDTTV